MVESKGGVISACMVVAYVAVLAAGLILETVALYVFWGAVVLVIYGYVGYPLVLRGMTAIKKQKVCYRETPRTVSLFISAYNERKVIRDKIKNSLALNYPKDKLEIVVASDGSTDGTDEILMAIDMFLI